MALRAGTRLGPYEIVAPVGAGAMGDVYRARDVRLDRDVAVKVLPPGLNVQPDRLERFEREARATSALNHPGVLAIYDVGVQDETPYVVSELLEGETLRERLAGSPLPPRKALDFALQMARGLAAAHDKGIVHRDLKPENLFVTRDGHLKILDFGLAKLREPTEEERAAAQDLSPTSPGTRPGIVLGTPEYMSPEQVRGLAVDHRSDIFSLGVVFYEMLTGDRVFQRATPADTMSAILREEPPGLAVDRWGRDLPPGLDAVARHCLEKRPEGRFQSAHDLAFNLEAVAGGWPAGSAALPPVRARARMGRPLLLGLAALSALALGFLAGREADRPDQPSFSRLTFRRGSLTSARFAPDGDTFVYSAEWEGRPAELFLGRTDSPGDRSLEIPAAEIFAISKAGEMALGLGRRYVRGFVYSGTLAVAPLAGGVPRRILEDVEAADWGPDGERLAIVREVGGRSRLEYPIGQVLYQTGGYVSHPRVSPDGQLVAFLDHPLRSDDGGAVVVVDGSGKKAVLSSGWLTAGGLAWSPDGREIYFTAASVGGARALHAVSLAGKRRLVVAVPGTLTLHDVAAGGRVLMARDDLRREIAGLPPGAAHERNLSWLDWSYPTDLSPDGRLLLFSERGEGGGVVPAVCLRGTDGGPPVRLGEGISTELSPDGRWAVALTPGSPTQLDLLPTGTGEPRPLTRDRINHQWAVFCPDGGCVVFSGDEPGHGARLYVQDLQGGPPRPFTPEGVRSVWHPVSADGRRVAAIGPDGAAYVYPLAGGEPTPIPGFAPGDRPIRWSPDGRSLYVFAQGEVPARVFRLELATGRRELWRELTPPDPAGVNLINPVLITPDAAAYVYSFRRILSDLYLVRGLG